MNLIQMRRILPKNLSDAASFCVMLAGIHVITAFETWVVLPFVYRNQEIDYSYYVHLSLVIFLYFNVMTNLYKLISTESGSAGIMLPIVLKEGWRFCSVCECNAPSRSYHCPICNKCILKRDHHCSFTGNCVGFANLRYYMHMLVYLFIGSIYANIMNFDYAFITLGGFNGKSLLMMTLPLVAWLTNLSETYTAATAFMTSICLLLSLLTGALLIYHSFNIVKGQTVVENTHNIRTYNLGWKKNVMLAFGRNWKYGWICPFIKSSLVGDGTQFSNQELFEATKDM